MNQQERMHQLLDQVISQQADAGTFAELQLLLREDPDGEKAAEIAVVLEASGHADLPAYDRVQGDALVNRILMVDRLALAPVVRFRYKWIAAAVLLLVSTGVAFLLLNRPSTPPPVLTHNNPITPADAQPGSSKATLILADGTVVTLDSLGNQVLQQGAVNIRQQGGMLAYDAQSANTPVGYNMLKTPRGGQFRLSLPDGTRVWINAASSLRYPTIFNGKDRAVELTGEAYFEVAKNTTQPFKVNINNRSEVEVLGTSFNVNAYEDEGRIHTTLLEGAIAVAVSSSQVASPDRSASRGQSVILKPGQQAEILVGEEVRQGGTGPSENATTKGNEQVGQITRPEIKVINNADLEKVVAWKNGVFNFQNASLEEVMRQLARWYDLEVVYERGVPDIQFFGEIGRNEKLSSLLKALEESKVHFRLEEGKRLVVLPK